MSEQPLTYLNAPRLLPFVRPRCERCGQPASVIDRLVFCGNCFLDETLARAQPRASVHAYNRRT